MAISNKKSFLERLEVAHLTTLMFSGIIFMGTVLLLLPYSHKKPLSFIDALFTATSATCVTGLLTINVAETFTTFGQCVIMLLIELGAIGIVTVSALFAIMLGKQISLKNSSIVHDTFTASQKVDIRKLVISVVTFLFAFEAIGAIFLTLLWMPEMGLRQASFHALFHSISAFCNAGISTFPNQMLGFEKNIPVTLVFTILLIAGGIGFLSIAEIQGKLKAKYLSKGGKEKIRWSFQIKLVFIYTFATIAIGSLLIIIFDSKWAHAGLSGSEQLMSAIFHTASSRTAGFATIDISRFENTTLYMFIILMFIGGAPVSTAGGIKVTTFGLLVGMAESRYRGSEKVQIMNRSIPEATMSRAISIVFIAGVVLLIACFVLLITESHPEAAPEQTRHEFLPIIFEAVSAFGTVGLSMGITPSLTITGKLVITILMLLGRLGPLTIAMAVATGKQKTPYEYAEASVMVG